MCTLLALEAAVEQSCFLNFLDFSVIGKKKVSCGEVQYAAQLGSLRLYYKASLRIRFGAAKHGQGRVLALRLD